MRLELYIYVKKLLFIRSISMLDDASIYKRIFVQRYLEFNQNRDISVMNRLHSPTFYMLKISDIFGLFDVVGEMLQGTRVYNKHQWRNIVWSKAWEIENQDWHFRTNLFKSTKFLSATITEVKPMIWWQLSDVSPDLIVCCETMSKLVCRASSLKCDNYQYKNDVVNRPYCEMCPDFALENTEHLLMHCSYFEEQRDIMFKQLNDLEEYYDMEILTPLGNNLHILLGRVPAEAIPDVLFL